MKEDFAKVKIAYLVFAYKNPQLLERAIDRLSSDECSFFIHIDQKSSIHEFSRIGERMCFLASIEYPCTGPNSLESKRYSS